MAQLEQITEQIRKDAKQQAEAIHADAQKKLNEERQQALEEAQKKANAIIEHAKRQKGAIQDRVLAETERKERNACLAAKQDLVRRVFEEAEEKLRHPDPAKVKAILEEYLRENPLEEGGVVELPEGFPALSDASVSVEYASDLVSGFRIRKNGMRENFDFPEIMHYLRQSLEQEVLQAMMEGEE